MNCEPPIPPVAVNPDNPFVVNAPDAFTLPQQNPYCADIDVKTITILIAGFLALAGQSITAAQLQTAAENYSCLPQSIQVPAAIWTVLEVLLNLPSGLAGGPGAIYSGNYGGNPPPLSPVTAAAIAIDSVTRQQWQWVAGSWS